MSDIWTVGHWTCSEETFIERLRAQQIEVLADVRAHPGSRTSPQFGKDTMPLWLERAGIDYVHLIDLGGRRKKQDVDQELNRGWQNVSFKNYADYTLTQEFENGLAHLVELATLRRTVVMCAEPMPWRCHRLILSNTLTERGWTVRHIMGDGAPRVHELGRWGATPLADDEGHLLYPE